MMQLTRRAALVGVGAMAACTPAPQTKQAATPSEGRIQVPGGSVVWRRFGEGSKTPLLGVHGGPGAPSDYIEPISWINDDRPVYLWDQLGCGRSDKPSDPSLWNIPRFIEEMHAVRNALGLNEVHIFGQSWGTCLTVDYLLAKGETGVKSVILSGPVMSARRYIADVRPMIRELSAEHQAAIAAAESSGNYNSPEYLAATDAFYALHIARHPTPETAPLYQRTKDGLGVECYVAMNGPSEFSFSGSLRDYEREAELPRLNSQILYMCGEFDTCTPAAGRQYASHTSHADVVVIPDAGHCTTIDEPEATNDAIRTFINAHEA